jgi:hypothetical protein
VGQSGAFVPQEERGRAAQVGLVVANRGRGVGCDRDHAALLEERKGGLDRYAPPVGKAEGAPHRAAKGFPGEWVGGPFGEDRAGGPRRLGRAKKPAEIARVLDRDRHEQQRRPPKQRLLGERRPFGESQETLTRFQLGHRRHQAFVDEANGNAVGFQIREQRAASERGLHSRRGRHAADRHTRLSRLLEQADSLDQDEVVVTPLLQLQQLLVERIGAAPDDLGGGTHRERRDNIMASAPARLGAVRVYMV